MPTTPSGSGSRPSRPGDPQSDRASKIAAAGPSGGTSRNGVIIGVIVAIAFVAGVTTAIVRGNRAATPVAASSSAPAGATATGTGATGTGATGSGTAAAGVPKGATGPGGGYVITTGTLKPGAPTLDIYEDFQCPVCKQVHQILGRTVEQLAAAGDAKVVVHVMSFLDDNFGNTFSKPVAAGAACAADAGKFAEYHNIAFANQAAEGSNLDDATIEGYATAAGITGAALETWKTCRADNTYAEFVAAVQETAGRAGINGTPTYVLNGTALKLSEDPEVLKSAVAAATGK